MFIFLGCLVITGIIVGLGIASDAGLSVPGYSSGSTTSTTTTTSETITKEKKNLSPNGESIIGLRSPSLVVTSQTGTPTTTTFDTTTYGDRAVLKLTNNTGSSLTLTGISIRGKIVSQLAGKNGYVWEYSDYDAIEKEGESFVEISNDFIFSPSQAKSIGDFVWKELKPHKLYALGLLGTHYEYEIGDVYHLTLNHTLNGCVMENIDSDVEVMGATIDRTVGSVGSTLLNLRVPSAAWELTLSKNAKLVGAGNSQRLNNRSNIVTVAASTWTGQADYFCDGADDNIEIQAAIDYVASLGGGSVELTAGQFNITESGTIQFAGSPAGYGCSVASNISMVGNGESTYIVYTYTTSTSFCFYCPSGTSNISISSMSESNYSANVNSHFLWCSLCSNTIIDSIKTTESLLINHGSASNFTDLGGNCSVVCCSGYLIRGSKLNISSSSFGQIRLSGYSNVSSSTMSGHAEHGLFFDYSYNTVSSCNISSSLIGAYFNFGSSYNILSACKVSNISDSGTSNVKVNNV